ncbi:hypothetical protein IFR05_005666 [Cadophora sp. M221]|nr:hypothetical protein IFR05_005666 [Cadophora sp. M221]
MATIPNPESETGSSAVAVTGAMGDSVVLAEMLRVLLDIKTRMGSDDSSDTSPNSGTTESVSSRHQSTGNRDVDPSIPAGTFRPPSRKHRELPEDRGIKYTPIDYRRRPKNSNVPSRRKSESGCCKSDCPFIPQATGPPDPNEGDQHMVTKEICQDYLVHACDREPPYQSIPTETQLDALPREYTWIDVLCDLLNNYTSPNKRARARIMPTDFDGIGRNFLLGLYWSERTHHDFAEMDLEDFELSHIPRTFEHIIDNLLPFVRIRRGEPSEPLTWRLALQISMAFSESILHRKPQFLTERQSRFLKETVELERYEEPTLKWNARHVLRKKLAALGWDEYAEETPETELSKLVKRLRSSPYYNYTLLLSDFDINNHPGLVDPLSLTAVENVYHGGSDCGGSGYWDAGIAIRRRRPRHGLQRRDASPRPHSTIRSREDEFSPAELALEALWDVQKNWKVIWTADINEHLSPESLRVEEVRRTYGIVFASISPTLKIDRARAKQEIFQYKLDGRKFMYDDWNSPPSLSPESIDLNLQYLGKLLGCYKSCPAPPRIKAFYDEILRLEKLNLKQSDEIRTIDHALQIAQESKIWCQDLLFHIQGILTYPHEEIESYSDYPYFGEKLQNFNRVVTSRRPRTLRELWRDQRDTLQWWTFWLVVYFGIASVILALGSLVTTILQTNVAYHPVG